LRVVEKYIAQEGTRCGETSKGSHEATEPDKGVHKYVIVVLDQVDIDTQLDWNLLLRWANVSRCLFL